MAIAVLRRLRFPNDSVHTISHCIRSHMRTMDVRRMRSYMNVQPVLSKNLIDRACEAYFVEI